MIKSTKYAKWINQSSLWRAGKIKNFSDYLKQFNANQRRNIKRERKAIEKAGIKVSVLNGNEINSQLINLMYLFYEQHCAKWGAWGSKYLSKEFFDQLSRQEQRDKVVLFSAHRADPKDPVAMSLCIKDKNMLWGRYWGSNEEINYLHFEVCYYSPIAWALDQGIDQFDPGAGGSHKRRRGFIAQPNTSLHRWYDKRMDHLIRPWLKTVNKMMFEEIKATKDELPLKIESPKLSLIN